MVTISFWKLAPRFSTDHSLMPVTAGQSCAERGLARLTETCFAIKRVSANLKKMEKLTLKRKRQLDPS